MGDISRKWEKKIAWTTNIIMILTTCVVSVIAFTGLIESVINIPAIRGSIELLINNRFYRYPMWSMILRGTGGYFTNSLFVINSIGIDNLVGLTTILAKTYSIILIVVDILAIIATVFMKKRIFSAVLFIIVSIINIFGVIFMSIPYLIVALLLFIRKRKKTLI